MNYNVFCEFLKLMFLFMSILFSLREVFRLYIAVSNGVKFDINKISLILLWLSISYIFTLMFL